MNVETELNDLLNKSRIQFNDFASNGKEGGDMALFAGKDKVKTVMRDILLLTTLDLKCIQSRLQEVLFIFNRLFSPCSMTKGRWDAIENSGKA